MKLSDVVSLLENAYPPRTAEDWDRVGLSVGDPDAEVRRVLVALDPLGAVADEALALGADLIVTHHPLLLRGVHSVAVTSPKGRLVHRLISGGCALFSAHTNADKAAEGTNDTLVGLLGLTGVTALVPEPSAPLDTLVTFVPQEDTQELLDALADAGAGRLGDYARAAFTSPGTGTFRPLDGANPTIGAVGRVETVAEDRLEIAVPRSRREAVVAALRAHHPYEEPAFTLVEHAPTRAPGALGLGRVGTLPREATLAGFADAVAAALPATVPGVLAGGPPDAPVRRVAICSGAGDSLLGAARAAGADVYLTSDLRHHPATDHLEDGAPWLVDATHYGTEAVVLEPMKLLLERGAREAGERLDVRLSRIVTDPWTYRATKRATP